MIFCITGLPRSRTAWFSAYFTACGYKCAHEGMRDCQSIIGYNKKMLDYDGNSDCGIALYPTTEKIVIIERDKDDVKKSLRKYFKNIGIVDLLHDKLKRLNGLRVKFDDIDIRLQEIHEYCVGNTYDSEVADMFKQFNITTNVLSTKNSEKILGELLCLG